MKQLSKSEILKALKGKLHSSQIETNQATMAVQVAYGKTDGKIIAFLRAQGFTGRGSDRIMGTDFEWLSKDFRPMTDDERMQM